MAQTSTKLIGLIHFTILLIVSLCIIIGKPDFVWGSLKENDFLKLNQKYPVNEEFAILPKCCYPRLKKLNNPFAKKCHKHLGVTVWTYYHHYCAGLTWMNRYNRSKMVGFGITGLTELQKRTLDTAIGEFKYADDHYAGYPQYIVAMKLKAIALWDIGHYKESLNTLKRGINAMPKHPELYLQLAKFLVRTGNKQQAFKVLQRGLSSTHGNKKIKEMLKTF